MGKFHDTVFPGESAAYRTARDELLAEEISLRRQVEKVAALRRGLPLGGEIGEDYVFGEAEEGQKTALSALFEDGKDSLIVYSFMYAPGAETACPACTSLLDGLNGIAPHVHDRTNFAVVAKAPVDQLRAWGLGRGWSNLRLLSSHANNYNTDYGAETPDGDQIPAINVFHRRAGAIHHSYNAELLYGPSEDGQNMRHADFIWPLWNLFDMTQEGRGADWFPKVDYS